MDEGSGPAAALAGRSAGPARAPAKRRRAKRVAWTAKRERTFLETLGQTANVAASARASGLSESAVRRRRAQVEPFREAWLAALRDGYAALETMLLDRALNGVVKPVWHGGKRVGSAREYSDRLALALLAAHRATVAGPGAARPARRPDEEVRATLLLRLTDMHTRLEAEVGSDA